MQICMQIFAGCRLVNDLPRWKSDGNILVAHAAGCKSGGYILRYIRFQVRFSPSVGSGVSATSENKLSCSLALPESVLGAASSPELGVSQNFVCVRSCHLRERMALYMYICIYMKI